MPQSPRNSSEAFGFVGHGKMGLAKSVFDCGLAEHTCPLEADGDAVGGTRGDCSFDIFVLASYPPYTAAAEAYLAGLVL